MYDELSSNGTWAWEAFTQLKYWKERILTQEARQNVGALEEALHAGTASTTDGASQAFSVVPRSNKSSKCKESWMDRLTKKSKVKTKGSGRVSRKLATKVAMPAKSQQNKTSVWENLPQRKRAKKVNASDASEGAT